eukprot:Rhum_TRINITY_DN3870_c0_g1::Rhum_TRINITY_DN3870_c0_g1_i1::g.12212::m.12212
MERALGLGSRRAAAMQGSSVLASVSGVSSNLSRQARFKTKFGRTNRAKKGNNFQNLQNPRWFYDLRMKVRSAEWKRRGLRNHFPETWVRNVDFVDSLESYVVDPEYHWEYYQQAHRQRLYNHPEDYTHFIDEVLEHVEKRPELWVPRCLRVMADLKERYGISQRQHTSYIKIFGRARFLKKAEEAYARIGEEKLPYNKENYLAMCRAYILSRDRITEKVAVQKCRELYTEALKKGIIQPEYITLISFEKFYDSLKRLGSELDNRTRSADWAENGHPLSRKNYDNETLWHNIKPNGRLPREWLLLGHPLNRNPDTSVEWKGVKKGTAYFHQTWKTYGYPSQIRFIEKWEQFRKDGKWTQWDVNSFHKQNFPQYFPAEEATSA